ncbi:MAG: calcium-binding protein [Pirellulaceae bacterium]
MNLLRKNQLTNLAAMFLLTLGGFLVLNHARQADAGNPLLKREAEFRVMDDDMARRVAEEYLEWTRPQDVDGTSKDDVIMTGAGDDTIQSYAGNDFINSGPGNDTIRSGPDNDLVYAGSGDDYVLSGSGEDVVYAGSGDDYVSAGDGNDRVYGESGDDRLYGDDGDDSLYGGPGDDVIKGERGNDFMHGGDGQDELHSWGGNDFMFGGADTDYFIIRPTGTVEYNVIIDFTPGVDVIDLTHPGIQIADFADLLNHCSQTSQGVRISLPTNNWGNDTLLLIGVTIADLDLLDFDI